MKKLDKEEVKLIVIAAALLLVSFFATGCARTETETIVSVENCSVSKVGEDAVITCPDGSEVVLPPTVINETVVTVNPVIIRVPVGKCKKH